MKDEKHADIQRPRERVLWVIVLVLGLFPFYLLTNHLTADSRTFTLWTPLDQAVPLDSRWEFVYALVYLYMLFPAFVIRSRSLFTRVCLGYVALFAVSIPTFLLFPVTFPRPSLEVDSFHAWGLRLNWFLDEPRNCFPSLHVSVACLASLAAWKVDRLVGAVGLLVAAAISLSTMFVKQHYLADVVGGAVLAGAVFWLLVRPWRSSGPGSRYSRKVAATPLYLYALGVAILFLCYRAGWRPWE